MQRSKALKIVALIEFLTAVVFVFLSVIMYISGEGVTPTKDELPVTFIFLIIAMISFISAPIVYFIARRIEESNR